jgi:hypothetical protein
MSSVSVVPETELMSGEQLSADDAWRTVRRYGLGHLLTTGFLRFRYGDGFSHARAFALQLALATVPLIIAGAGLAAALGVESFAEVVARTVVALSPGGSDALVADVVEGGSEEGSEKVRSSSPSASAPRSWPQRRRSPSSNVVRTAYTAPTGTARRCASTPARPCSPRRRDRRWRSACC